MNNPFETIRASDRDIVKSYDWYMRQIKLLAAARLRPSSLLRSEIGTVTNRIQVGSMYLFMYDPKLKVTLPVYDRFPLVLPFRKTEDGFVGLNLHYLPYLIRARLLGALYKLATTKPNDPNLRLRLSWELLDNASRFSGAQVCVKRYLTSHLRSAFFQINTADWKAAIFLPVEDFVKQSKNQVFQNTRRRM